MLLSLARRGSTLAAPVRHWSQGLRTHIARPFSTSSVEVEGPSFRGLGNEFSEGSLSVNEFSPEKIRTFSIIAHIDHGKSTLADRLLEKAGTINSRNKDNARILDKLEVEKQRGITVKANSATLFGEVDGERYMLNLIDTPGHVDFNYEVTRSLSACDGVILLVDAAQGIQAQTMANFWLAFNSDLTIIPVLNKIDAPTAEPEKVREQICDVFDFEPEEVLAVSAKTGEGMDGLLPALVKRVPPPTVHDGDLKALLFDSWYDEYRGVICLVAVKSGVISKGMKIVASHSEAKYEVLDIGVMHPDLCSTGVLHSGQVGYIITGMKTAAEALVGDTFHELRKPVTPFPGFRLPRPMVYAGMYPIDANDYDRLRQSVERLTLNDTSVSVQRESTPALGQGFRCGFLGVLHMEVFHTRLEQEHGASVIATTPTVPYQAELLSGELLQFDSPADFPEKNAVSSYREPMVESTIITPSEYLGNVINLCHDRRGTQTNISPLDDKRLLVQYRLPLSEVITDFFNNLKSATSGYATVDHEDAGYQESEVVKMSILLNGQPVDALAVIVHKDKVVGMARQVTAKLKEVVDRQMYEIVIQAAVGTKILARETIKPFRKNVTAKCYGGDVTRKRKLLEKQKAGKKKMKRIGNVDLSQEAFLSVISNK